MAKNSEGWSEEKCLQLIREFRKRPILWDQKCPLFYRKRVKASAWIEISKILQMPPDSCTRKMSILMSSFRREKAKIVHTLKHEISPTDASLSSWFGFEEMAFILDKESERQRKKTGTAQLPLEHPDDEDDDDDPNIGEESTSRSPVMVPVPVPVPEFEPPHTNVEGPKYLKRSVLEIDQRRKKMKIKKLHQTKPKIDESVVEQARVEKEQPKSQQNEEEIKYFSHFIATKMMKYSETTKNAVQQAICDIIFQADQGRFETTTKETCMSSYLDPLKQASGIGQMPSSSDMIKVYYSDSDESN